MSVLRLDFETRGVLPLGGKDSVGLYNYANSDQTSILMLGYKLPESKKVELWEPHLGAMPANLLAALVDSEVTVSAFNSAFERYMLQYKLSIAIPASRFIDPQVGARYLSMPGDLESVCEILDLPPNLQKDKRGEALIDLFSLPKTRKKKEGGGVYFNDWVSHPKEWEEFCEYCRKDVVAEEEISRRMEILGALHLPSFERKLWIFDQKVNDRGMPVDEDFVQKAYGLALRAKKEALEKQNKLTGLENANSQAQLLPWVKARGYLFNTLRKETVDAVLKDPETQITPECREVLKARREAASTTYTKLAAILRQVCSDGRIRNLFIFMGSSRCGRWAGSGLQFHNMARPDGTFEKRQNLDDARALIYAEDYEGIKERFKTTEKDGTEKLGSVLLVIKNVIRTVFVAPKAT